LGLAPSASFFQSSTFVFIFIELFSEGQAAEAWEHSEISFGNWGESGRERVSDVCCPKSKRVGFIVG
jgi:hypothetical protein